MNPRPLGPEPSALPNCATPRYRIVEPTIGRSTTSWSSSPRSAEFSHCRQGNARIRARRLLSPKISLASLPAIFGDPGHARYQTALHLDIELLNQPSAVPRPLGPRRRVRRSSRIAGRAMLAFALGGSSPQKSRSLRSLRFSGTPVTRATKLRYTSIHSIERCQTALRLDSLSIIAKYKIFVN